jgi:hypothetical protein
LGEWVRLEYDPEFPESHFPSLRRPNYKITSPIAIHYNCVAWAFEDDARPWWPHETAPYFWPPGIARTETVESFVHAFTFFGFEPCDSRDLESGFQKIALYVDGYGVPTHVARQIETGWWSSKMAMREDIEHDSLSAVEGEYFGKVSHIFRKRLQR